MKKRPKKIFLLTGLSLILLLNISQAKKAKTLALEKIKILPYHKEGLAFLNDIQYKMGNKGAVIDNFLLNAAKSHAAYLARHFDNKKVSLKWHYQNPKKMGFFGKNPKEQVQAFGYKPKDEYIIINTTTGWTSNRYAEPKYLIEHFTGTIFHRWLTIAPEVNKVGFYKLSKGVQNKRYLLVTFYSVKLYPKKPVQLFYPFKNQTEIPTTILPELPAPFHGNKKAGYPITFQYFSKNPKDVPVLRKAWLKGPLNKYIPIYRVTPKSPGQAGKMAKSFKIIAIAGKKPLLNETRYTVYMKISNRWGKIIFNKKWNFTTEEATVPVMYSF